MPAACTPAPASTGVGGVRRCARTPPRPASRLTGAAARTRSIPPLLAGFGRARPVVTHPADPRGRGRRRPRSCCPCGAAASGDAHRRRDRPILLSTRAGGAAVALGRAPDAVAGADRWGTDAGAVSPGAAAATTGVAARRVAGVAAEPGRLHGPCVRRCGSPRGCARRHALPPWQWAPRQWEPRQRPPLRTSPPSAGAHHRRPAPHCSRQPVCVCRADFALGGGRTNPSSRPFLPSRPPSHRLLGRGFMGCRGNFLYATPMTERGEQQ